MDTEPAAGMTGTEDLVVTVKRCCGNCLHFQNDPAKIEAAFRGLTAMCSGSASVRAHDGLCDRHDVYLSFHDVCGDFQATESRPEMKNAE